MRLPLLTFCLVMLGAAAPVPEQGGTIPERYERARSVLEEQRAEERTMRAARERLEDEVESLSERLVTIAADVQEREAALAATSAEIEQLRSRESELRIAFERDREKVGHLLAILQRLDADAPPALVVRSDDSLAAARGAMLLGSMLPPVYEQAAGLGRQLRALSQTRADLEAKNVQAEEEAAALGAARRELRIALAERTREADSAAARLGEIQAITEEAVRQTSDLETLLNRIAALRAQADPEGGVVVVSSQSAPRQGLARGSLVRPVVGTVQAGDPAGPGETPGTGGPQGLWFVAGGAAQAVAPADSEVIFAGAYQKFGQVLILEIGGGYHLLLAGFGQIDVQTGDLVLAGEPVGVLPGGDAARLYMELRSDGQAVDPAPWISVDLRKASRG